MVKKKAPGQRARPRKEVAVKLKARKTLKSRKPAFRRQEGFRQAMLRDTWRRPRGKHSKLRKHRKARGARPKPGYGSPREVRGLNRLGYREVRVSSPGDLGRINPSEEMALLSGTVGKRKRAEILKLAQEKGIQVANA